MAPTRSSAARKPSKRMAAEIANYNAVPRSTEEYGTYKFSSRSWYAITAQTPCDYLTKYETCGVAKGMIRFARLEARTNAPISVGELAVRVAALQEAHDATALSGLEQAKMRAIVWIPWRRELIARGYGKWDISQLFWAKMEDGEGDEIRVGEAPEEDDESDEDEDEKMDEEMAVDKKSLGKELENSDANVTNEASNDEQVQTNGDHEREMSREMGLDTEQRDDDGGFPETGLDTVGDRGINGMVIDQNAVRDGEANVDERRLKRASRNSNGDVSIAGCVPQDMQREDHNGMRTDEESAAEDEHLDRAPKDTDRGISIEAHQAETIEMQDNGDKKAGEEMALDEQQVGEVSENSAKEVSIEVRDTQEMPSDRNDGAETGEEMDLDPDQIYSGQDLEENSDLADLRTLFPNGNW